MRLDPLLNLRRVGLHPAKEGGVGDRDTAVLKHQFEIAVADREHQVPPDCPEDHLGGELPTFEGLILPHRGHSPPSRHALVCTQPLGRRKAATEPPRAHPELRLTCSSFFRVWPPGRSHWPSRARPSLTRWSTPLTSLPLPCSSAASRSWICGSLACSAAARWARSQDPPCGSPPAALCLRRPLASCSSAPGRSPMLKTQPFS